MKDTRKDSGQDFKCAAVWLPRTQHEKLKKIAKKERRSVSAILYFAVSQIIKAGASGIDHAT